MSNATNRKKPVKKTESTKKTAPKALNEEIASQVLLAELDLGPEENLEGEENTPLENSSSEEELGFFTRLTRDDVAGLIEAMAESLKEGVFNVQKSDCSLQLKAPRVVDLEVRAVRNNERSAFMFEVSWRNKPIEVPEDTEGDTESDGADETALNEEIQEEEQ